MEKPSCVLDIAIGIAIIGSLMFMGGFMNQQKYLAGAGMLVTLISTVIVGILARQFCSR